MLARTRKTAAELGLNPRHLAALELTLTALRSGFLVHSSEARALDHPRQFNMSHWLEYSHCGTVACIGGWAERLGRANFNREDAPFGSNCPPGDPRREELSWLFFPKSRGARWKWEKITTAQAAEALESYLATGSPRWDVILGEVAAARKVDHAAA